MSYIVFPCISMAKIQQIPSATVAPQPVIQSDSTLLRWFVTMRSGKNLYVSIQHVEVFLQQDLKMNLAQLDSQLTTALPYLTVVFLKKWPGWYHLKNDPEWSKASLHILVGQLKLYLIEKLKFIINQGYELAMKEILTESASKTGANIIFSPYSLDIKCPPSTMNSMFFTEHGNDIVVKEHAERTLKALTTPQLLHWPFVQVCFIGPEISFVRRQANEYIRYLNSTPHQYTISDKSVVESVEIEDRNISRTCYTYRMIKEYVAGYLKCLKQLQTSKELNTEEYEEIETILNNFVQDIAEMDINQTIATNTKILFKLCNLKYARVKKMHKLNSTESSRVGYCEVQVPKVELSLNYFHAKQQTTNSSKDIQFVFLNDCERRKELGLLVPVISYYCTYCKISFAKSATKSAKANIFEHYANCHKMEQPLRCAMCKTEFELAVLTANRWKHNCVIAL